MAITVRIGRATLILGDCLEHAARLVAADAIISDPPYGIDYRVNARDWSGDKLDASGRVYGEAREPIEGDDRPFDPGAVAHGPAPRLFRRQQFRASVAGRSQMDRVGQAP